MTTFIIKAMKRYTTISLILTAIILIFESCGRNSEYRHPSATDSAIVYELNTRQFTPEGTLSQARTRLTHLKELGVNVIILAPVQPIGRENRLGELGNVYSIQNHTAVNPELGTIEEFREFTDEAHRLGFKVLIDWVGGHTSRDAVWLENEDWYVRDEEGIAIAPEDKMDGARLNYQNMDMRGEMLKSMHFWLREGHIDGFRCVFADEVPADYWKHSITQLRDERRELIMIADTDFDSPHSQAFNISTSHKLHRLIRDISNGKAGADALKNYIVETGKNEPLRMNFTSNHEENEWNGTEFDRLGDSVKCFAALCYLLRDVPMISNGQEVGSNRSLNNFVHDPINWKGTEKREFLKLYRALNQLKVNNSALHAGAKGGDIEFLPNSGDDKVLSFIRDSGGDRCMAIVNLSPKPTEVTVEFGGNEGDYINVLESTLTRVSKSENISLNGWDIVILSNC